MKTLSLKPPGEEYMRRQDVLRDNLHRLDLSGVILFDDFYIQYYTGFAFIPTERPIVWLLSTSGETLLYVPFLEAEHAQKNARVDRVETYPEYPSQIHPMLRIAELMHSISITDRYAADQDGYPAVFGYLGPKLSDVTGSKVNIISKIIENQMMIKSQVEINLIKESVKWAHLAHTLLQRYTRVGLTETEVSLRASMEATLVMMDTIGPLFQAQNPFSTGPGAGYRGQIGRNAAIPHALANNLTFMPGDVLVTGASAPIWGYNSELERTMIVGDPTDEQCNWFERMLALQDVALQNMRPGVSCSEVDLAVRAYYEKNELMPFWRHHSGHGIGLRYHEGPFLDVGDQTVLEPGMVFTVEPGLYVPGLGGFRHSDTVVIVEDGIEILTYYPRDISSLTIPLR